MYLFIWVSVALWDRWESYYLLAHFLVFTCCYRHNWCPITISQGKESPFVNETGTREMARPRSYITVMAEAELLVFLCPDLVHQPTSQEFRMSRQGVTGWDSRHMCLVSRRRVIGTEGGFGLFKSCSSLTGLQVRVFWLMSMGKNIVYTLMKL